LPGKLLQNVISHGIAKVAEFLDGCEVTVSALGFTSAMLQGIGSKIIDELRVVISDNRKSTAYFTFTTQMGPPVQELRLFGQSGAIIVDNLHRTAIYVNQSNSDRKSYLNFIVPPRAIARQYVRNMWTNVAAFLRADFHMDAGMKNLIEGFYRSIRSDSAPPISYREILLTTSIMDEIFRQVRPGLKTASPSFIANQPAVAVSLEGL
jgi:hypothetical protein